MALEVERIVAVDWSGDKGAGQKKKIWAAVWTAANGRVQLESGRTRIELCEWLIALAAETPRMVVGFDFCFSYPAWFLEELGCKTVYDLWRIVAEGKGERWLSRECSDERFWGVAGTARSGKRPGQFCGDGLRRMMRTTDWANKIEPRKSAGMTPLDAPVSFGLSTNEMLRAAMAGITAKSPFQIGGSGSVGTGSLRGMPTLLRLREAGFRIWPFEHAALTAHPPTPLVVEMYTRLLTGAVKKSNPLARQAYLAARRQADPTYSALARAVLARAAESEDAFDALVCALEMVRWQHEFPALRQTEDVILAREGITWRPGLTFA